MDCFPTAVIADACVRLKLPVEGAEAERFVRRGIFFNRKPNLERRPALRRAKGGETLTEAARPREQIDYRHRLRALSRHVLSEHRILEECTSARQQPSWHASTG